MEEIFELRDRNIQSVCQRIRNEHEIAQLWTSPQPDNESLHFDFPKLEGFFDKDRRPRKRYCRFWKHFKPNLERNAATCLLCQRTFEYNQFRENRCYKLHIEQYHGSVADFDRQFDDEFKNSFIYLTDGRHDSAKCKTCKKVYSLRGGDYYIQRHFYKHRDNMVD